MIINESIQTVIAAVKLLRWKRKISNFNFDYCPDTGNPKFMSASDAVALIPDNACLMGMGMTVSARPAILWSAIGRRFRTTGSPKNLTVITAGGAGGRGKIPGSVEEVGLNGLNTLFISGHLETARAQLALADAGHCVLGVLPQGVIAHLAEAQGQGKDHIVSKVGVGTFMDPRIGSGSQVIPGLGEQLVSAEGDKLKYRIPEVSAAVVIAPSADIEGNIYVKDAVIYSEAKEAVLAAKRNGGVSIVTVAKIIPRDESAIYIKAECIDAIVLNPRNDITATVEQNKPWKELMPGDRGSIDRASAKIKALNRVIRADPERTDIDLVLARQAARIFSKIAHPEASCVIGYGMPQEVSRQIMNGGIGRNLTFMLETGIYGGLPAPGFFFGLAYHPKKLMSSAEIFHVVEKNLDITILGTLQVDQEGNVNVSKKAPGPKNYIGPGGFLNLVACARKIIFVGGFMAKSRIEIKNSELRVIEPGIPKFVKKVDEITFSAGEALKAGKEVYYVTHIGAFRLTEKGLELISVAPGIDIERDIMANSEARISLPADGMVELFEQGVVSGKNFRLNWNNSINGLSRRSG